MSLSHHHSHPPGHGRSSFELVDADRLFERLQLTPATTLLDLGCGAGAYSLAAARRMGPAGIVHAVDLWPEGVAQLCEAATNSGLAQIRAVVADARDLPLGNASVDLCLMTTVFHDLVHDNAHEKALGQLRRVLRPDGRVAVVEFEPADGPPGPPRHIRLAPEELRRIFAAEGFNQRLSGPCGEYTYLSVFARAPVSGAPRAVA